MGLFVCASWCLCVFYFFFFTANKGQSCDKTCSSSYIVIQIRIKTKQKLLSNYQLRLKRNGGFHEYQLKDDKIYYSPGSIAIEKNQNGVYPFFPIITDQICLTNFFSFLFFFRLFRYFLFHRFPTYLFSMSVVNKEVASDQRQSLIPFVVIYLYLMILSSKFANDKLNASSLNNPPLSFYFDITLG